MSKYIENQDKVTIDIRGEDRTFGHIRYHFKDGELLLQATFRRDGITRDEMGIVSEKFQDFMKEINSTI